MSRILSHHHLSIMTILSWRPLISSNDQEENLMAGEKNSLSQLQRSRDRATFGIPFVMESGMHKPFFPFDLDKRAFSLCVDLVWNNY